MCGLWTTQGPKGNLEIFILLPHLISLSITNESIKADRKGFPGGTAVNNLPASIGDARDALFPVGCVALPSLHHLPVPQLPRLSNGMLA